MMRQTLSQTQSQIQTLSQKQYQIYNSMLIRDMNKFYEECFNNPLLKYNRRKDVLVKDIVKFENVDDRLISEYYEHTFEEFDEATYDGLPKKKSMNKAVASTPFLVIHIEDGYLRYEVKKSLFKSFELNLNTKESLNLLPEENELFQKHLLEAKKLGPNFYINARNFASSPNETEFEIFLKDVNGTGNYPLNTTMPNRSTGASYGFYVKRKLSPISEWLTSAVHGGVVHISFLDTTNHIIAGTFNFSAADNFGTAPVLQVTEGRFDLNY